MTIEDAIRNAVCNATHMLHQVAVAPHEYASEIEWKKPGDPVTPYDKKVERDIRKAVAKYSVAINGEEFGNNTNSPENAGKDALYIDPIDGTKSFITGRHGSAVSVGLTKSGELTMGAVGDIMSGVVYYADQDYGARYDVLTGRMGALSQRSPLPKPFLAANDEALPLMAQAKSKGFSVCIAPCVASNLALVAAGIYDAYVLYPRGDGGPNAHDVAGGLGLCKYAGVISTDLEGNPFDLQKTNRGIIAAWPDVHSKVLEMVVKDREPVYGWHPF